MIVFGNLRPANPGIDYSELHKQLGGTSFYNTLNESLTKIVYNTTVSKLTVNLGE